MGISKEQVTGLQNALESYEIVEVSFLKANGDLREMVCCIKPEVVGDVYDFVGGTESNVIDADLQRVWEPAIKEWRNFHYSAVQNWSVSH